VEIFRLDFFAKLYSELSRVTLSSTAQVNAAQAVQLSPQILCTQERMLRSSPAFSWSSRLQQISVSLITALSSMRCNDRGRS